MAIQFKKKATVALGGCITHQWQGEGQCPYCKDSMFREDTSELYEKAQTASSDSKKVMIPEELHKSRLGRAADLLTAVVTPPSKILDMGCGYGALLDYLPKSYEYWGVDANPQLIAKAKDTHPGHKFQQGVLNESAPTEVWADYVVCLGVACHLKPGKEYLARFATALTALATKGVVVEFQKAEVYKGAFTSHSEEEITAAFGQRLRASNVLHDPKDSTITVFFRLW